MTVKKKNMVSRSFALFVAVVMCAMMVVPAFAGTYAERDWLQAVKPKEIIDLGYMEPGSDINTSGIDFFFVATLSSSGEFRVLLQRKGAFGMWFALNEESSFRTAGQCHDYKYDPIHGGRVFGQPNVLYWPTNEAGEYQIVLENPTIPQSIGLTKIKAWAYGS